MAFLGISYTNWGSTVTYDAGNLASSTASITAVSAGTGAASGTVTYTAANSFVAGQSVVITGITAAYNIIGTIASATSSQFTITSSATGSTGTGTAMVLWSSKTDSNLNNAVGNNSYWGPYNHAYTWFADSGNGGLYTLKTDSIKTETHDLFVGTVYHNVGSAGTLYIEQSPDNKNWDVANSTSVTTATGTSFSQAIVSPFLRLKFASTASVVPTTLRLNGKTADSGVKY